MINRIKKRHLALLIFLGLGCGLFLFLYQSDSTPSFIIRPYNEETDFKPLVELMNKNMFWISERKEFSPERMLTLRAPFDDLSRKGEAKIEVAESMGQTVGFISYLKNSPREGYIWLLAVEKDHRDKGIGKALMKSAIASLKKLNADYIILVTRTINEPALRLYQQLGFVKKSVNERGMITLILRNP